MKHEQKRSAIVIFSLVLFVCFSVPVAAAPSTIDVTGEITTTSTANPGVTVGDGSTGYITVGNSQVYDAAGDLTLDSDSGEVYIPDELGIGTNSPEWDLHVDNTASGGVISVTSGTTQTAQIAFGDTDDSVVGRVLYDNDDDSLSLRTNNHGTSDLHIDSSGNVGIGTSSPAQLLAISGNSLSGINVTAEYSGTRELDSRYYFRGSNSSDLHVLLRHDGQAYFAGNVGVGTSSPGANLHVDGSAAWTSTYAPHAGVQSSRPAIAFFDDNYAGSPNATVLFKNNDDFIIAQTDYTSDDWGYDERDEVFAIDGTGNVGIGTSSPAYNLEVQSNSGNAEVLIRTTDGNNPGLLLTNNSIGTTLFVQNGYLRIANTTGTSWGGANHVNLDLVTGNMGIGGTPAYTLDVYGNARLSTTSSLLWGDANTQIYGVDGGSGYIAFRTGSAAERMRIDSDGNVGIGTDSPGELLDVYSSTAYAEVEIHSDATGQAAWVSMDSVDDHAGLVLRRAGSNKWLVFNDGDGDDDLRIGQSTADIKVTVENGTGNVGIGTTTPDGTLDVGGDIHMTGARTTLFYRGDTDSHIGGVQMAYAGSGIHVWTPTNSSGDTQDDTIRFGGFGNFNSNTVGLRVSGDVGIGTSSPDAMLTLNAFSAGFDNTKGISFRPGFDVNASGGAGILAQDQPGITTTDGLGLYGTNGISFFTNGPNRRMIIDKTNGYVGIGTTSPAAKLHTVADSAYTWATGHPIMAGDASEPTKRVNIGFDAAIDAGYILAIDQGTANKDLVLNPTGGNVGIGTSSPGYALDVLNTASTIPARFRASSHTYLALDTQVAGNQTGIIFYDAGTPHWLIESFGIAEDLRIYSYDLGDTVMYFDNDTGNVGIGTADPGDLLNIYESSAETGDSTGDLLLIQDVAGSTGNRAGIALTAGGGAGNIGARIVAVDDGSWGADLVFETRDESSTGTDTDERMRIDSDTGNVGIGTASPDELLDVAGNVTADAYFFNSDARLKENIRSIANPVEKIKQLRGVRYDLIEGGPSVGIIAQDVEKIFPEIVKESHDGMKRVQTANLVGPLIEATKAQQELIEEQQTTIDALKQIVCRNHPDEEVCA